MNMEKSSGMPKVADIFKALLGLLLFFAIGFHAGSHRNRPTVRIIERVDTLTVYKEFVDTEAVLAARIPKGYNIYKVGTVDSLSRLASKPPKEVLVEVPRIVRHDSIIYIQVPMEERVFTGSKDSVDYKIWTHGFNTEVTKVAFHYPQTTVTKERTIYKERSRFGIGASVGYGVSKDGFSPYIGVGINYNLISF